jgi:hypothetical protein
MSAGLHCIGVGPGEGERKDAVHGRADGLQLLLRLALRIGGLQLISLDLQIDGRFSMREQGLVEGTMGVVERQGKSAREKQEKEKRLA